MAEVDKREKITINEGLVDLGQIDLLVDEGFYANRTDFIRTAIRRQLETLSVAVEQTVARRTLELGAHHSERATHERAQGTQPIGLSYRYGAPFDVRTEPRPARSHSENRCPDAGC
jgi:Arc/MetJ-type ribon-helix-helix transcriptional regulator